MYETSWDWKIDYLQHVLLANRRGGLLLVVSAEACVAFIKSTTAYFVKYQSLLSCSCKNNKAESGYRFIFLFLFIFIFLPRPRRRPKADLGVCLQTPWILTLLENSRRNCQIAGPISAALPAYCDFAAKCQRVGSMRQAVKNYDFSFLS